MVQIPTTYPPVQEPAIATYNFTDIAEGTGIVAFHGYTWQETTNTNYGISEQTNFPATLYTTIQAGWNSGAFAKVLDLDFDSGEFNLPKDIKGTANVSGAFGTGSATSATSNLCYIIVKLRHWDGTTETEIANEQSPTLTSTSQQINWKTYNMQIPVTSAVHFKKGDQIRVTVEVWAYNTAEGESAAVYFLHDPKDRTGATDIPQDEGGVPATSDFKIDIPFRIDL